MHFSGAKFLLYSFRIQQFKFFTKENATLPLTSITKLSKKCPEKLAKCLNLYKTWINFKKMLLSNGIQSLKHVGQRKPSKFVMYAKMH